jgi:hypothetical protein
MNSQLADFLWAISELLPFIRETIHQELHYRCKRQEHIFKCPKCGMTSDREFNAAMDLGVNVILRKKLHLYCGRCEHKWQEDALDKGGG